MRKALQTPSYILQKIENIENPTYDWSTLGISHPKKTSIHCFKE
jgi:hypothetical protein